MIQRLHFVKNNLVRQLLLHGIANVSVSNGNSAIIYADGAGSGAAVVDLSSTLPAAGALLMAVYQMYDAGTSRTNLGLRLGQMFWRMPQTTGICSGSCPTTSVD